MPSLAEPKVKISNLNSGRIVGVSPQAESRAKSRDQRSRSAICAAFSFLLRRISSRNLALAKRQAKDALALTVTETGIGPSDAVAQDP